VGRALTALGSVLFHEGKLIEGTKVLGEAVQIQSNAEVEQADLVESLTYLADCHQHLGHNSMASSLHRRILGLDRRIYGDRHPQVAEDLSNLAEAAAGLGKYHEAEQYDRQALEIEQAWYGQNHVETGVVEIGLGKTLVLGGKYAEGTHVLQQALSTVEPTVGNTHPFVSAAVQWLGVAAEKEHRLNEAEADFQRLAQITKAVYGNENGHQGVISLRFGEVRFARKQFGEAELLFRDAVKRFSIAFSPDSSLSAIARIHLGSTMVQEQRWREAEPELLAGYRIVTSDDNLAPDSALEARIGLVSVYEALRVPEKAKRFREELR
jgi:tetratricopeptide (TPR) repeat protein